MTIVYAITTMSGDHLSVLKCELTLFRLLMLEANEHLICLVWRSTRDKLPLLTHPHSLHRILHS